MIWLETGATCTIYVYMYGTVVCQAGLQKEENYQTLVVRKWMMKYRSQMGAQSCIDHIAWLAVYICHEHA